MVKPRKILILGDEANRATLIADMIEIEAVKLGVSVDTETTSERSVIEGMNVKRTPAIAVNGAVRLVFDQKVDNLPDTAVIRRWLVG